jgi:hypothetical protein
MVRDDGAHAEGRAPLAVGLCKDGTLIVGDRRVPTNLVAPEREGVLMHLIGSDKVVVGTTKGEVVVVSVDGRILSARSVVQGMVRLLAPSPDGRLLAVAGEGDPILIVTLPGLAHIASLPRRARSMAWDPERAGELVSTGRWVERWRLRSSPSLRPLGGAHLIPLDDGVVALDVDPERPERVVVSFGPHVGVLDSLGGRSRELDIITAKGASFDGEVLMAAGGRGLFELDAGTLEPIEPSPIESWAVRRMVTLSDGTRLVAPYATLRRYVPRSCTVAGGGCTEAREAALASADPRGDFVTEAVGPTLDLGVSPNRRFAIFLRESDRSLFRVRAGRLGAEEVGADLLAEAAAIGSGGDRIFTARTGSVAQWDDEGHLAMRFEAGDAPLIDVEVSHDGRWVAAGGRDGVVLVWSADRPWPLARFSDHKERVPALEFSADSRHLLSGSWDRTLRVRDLAVLDAPIDSLAATLRGRYAMGLEEALGGRERSPGRDEPGSTWRRSSPMMSP